MDQLQKKALKAFKKLEYTYSSHGLNVVFDFMSLIKRGKSTAQRDLEYARLIEEKMDQF